MNVGEHILSGRPGKTRYEIDEKKRATRKTERIVTKNEVVYLFPHTPAIDAAVRKFGNNPAAIATELGVAARYKARTFTDDDGFFRFRGLKPGRYLLMTAVPYEAATITADDTGKVRTTTFFDYNGWFISGATSVSEPIYRYRNTVSKFDHPIVKVVDVRPDKPQTALGEIE